MRERSKASRTTRISNIIQRWIASRPSCTFWGCSKVIEMDAHAAHCLRANTLIQMLFRYHIYRTSTDSLTAYILDFGRNRTPCGRAIQSVANNKGNGISAPVICYHRQRSCHYCERVKGDSGDGFSICIEFCQGSPRATKTWREFFAML